MLAFCTCRTHSASHRQTGKQAGCFGMGAQKVFTHLCKYKRKSGQTWAVCKPASRSGLSFVRKPVMENPVLNVRARVCVSVQVFIILPSAACAHNTVQGLYYVH